MDDKDKLISDFILTIELMLHGREWDEDDKIKAKRLVDYAQGLIGYPKDIGAVARICKIDYPPTELERLRDEVKGLNKLVVELQKIPQQRLDTVKGMDGEWVKPNPAYLCACEEIKVFMDAEIERYKNKETGGTIVMENKQ